jgi:hypothetical protein
MTPEYVAGFIDGEGCIDVQIHPDGYCRPRLRISQCEHQSHILYLLKDKFGGSVHKRQSQRPNQSDSCSWEFLGRKAMLEILTLITPHLVVKKQQALLAIWWLENVTGKQVGNEVRQALRNELSRMKRDPQRLSEEAAAEIRLLMR